MQKYQRIRKFALHYGSAGVRWAFDGYESMHTCRLSRALGASRLAYMDLIAEQSGKLLQSNEIREAVADVLENGFVWNGMHWRWLHGKFGQGRGLMIGQSSDATESADCTVDEIVQWHIPPNSKNNQMPMGRYCSRMDLLFSRTIPTT